jgi:hypothetical protein
MLRMECRIAALMVAMLAAPVWAQDNLTGGTSGQTAPGGDCCVPACYRGPGLIVFADYLNWKARSDSLEFVDRFSTVNATQTTTTEAENVSLPQQSGFRAGLGYRFASQWDVAWSYTYYFTNGQNAADAAIGAGLTVPGIVSMGALRHVAGQANLRYNVNDLEIGRWIHLDDHVDLRLFGSVRYAMTETNGREDLTGHYFDELRADVDTVGNTHIRSKMDACGIRLGGEGRWRIGDSNLSLFGRGAGSVLAGRFENVGTYFVEGTSSRDPYYDYQNTFVNRHNDTHAVCVIEAAAGVAYQYGNWELSGGYELATWFNQAVPITNVNEVTYHDLLLDGFFGRLAYRY